MPMYIVESVRPVHPEQSTRLVSVTVEVQIVRVAPPVKEGRTVAVLTQSDVARGETAGGAGKLGGDGITGGGDRAGGGDRIGGGERTGGGSRTGAEPRVGAAS